MSRLAIARNARRARGMTLVELMVALVLGVLVLGGLVQVFVNINETNRVTTGLARMQENARYALDRIVSDLQMTGAQYCSSFDNKFPLSGRTSKRAMRIHVDNSPNGMPFGMPDMTTVQPAGAVGPLNWLMSPRYLMQGHECPGAGCAPAFTAPVTAVGLPVPPAAGVAAGTRLQGTDVLTLRYLAAPGVPLFADAPAGGPYQVYGPAVPGNVNSPPLSFQPGDYAMVTNCAAAEVFEANAAGNLVTPADSGDAGATRNLVGAFNRDNDARMFNFTRDFRTVTYYVVNRDDADEPGRRIPVLVRQENGVPQDIVEGIERFDLRYGVELFDRRIRYMTADQVDAAPIAQCPPRPDGLAANEPGCLWRAVRTVEVALLANTVDNVTPTPTDTYSYTFAGTVNAAPTEPMPVTNLPRGRMLRREFRATVALRNGNY